MGVAEESGRKTDAKGDRGKGGDERITDRRKERKSRRDCVEKAYQYYGSGWESKRKFAER